MAFNLWLTLNIALYIQAWLTLKMAFNVLLVCTNQDGVVVGGGWEAKGGLNHLLAQGKSRCVFNKAQKQPQCTCQDKTVVGSSLTPHAALLLCSSGTNHPWRSFIISYFTFKRHYCTTSRKVASSIHTKQN